MSRTLIFLLLLTGCVKSSAPAPYQETLKDRADICNNLYSHMIDMAADRYASEELKTKPGPVALSLIRTAMESNFEERGLQISFSSHCMLTMTLDQVSCELKASNFNAASACELSDGGTD